MSGALVRWTVGRVFIWLLLASGGVGITANQTPAQESLAALIARIEAPQLPNRQGLDGYTMQELMQRFRVPGVSIAVMKDLEIHWAKGYGVVDVDKGRPVETNTPFQAASISKPVTAMAAMRVVQERRLTLDGDINATLKSWRVPTSELTRDQAVTPRALFSHTSGADDGFGFRRCRLWIRPVSWRAPHCAKPCARTRPTLGWTGGADTPAHDVRCGGRSSADYWASAAGATVCRLG